MPDLGALSGELGRTGCGKHRTQRTHLRTLAVACDNSASPVARTGHASRCKPVPEESRCAVLIADGGCTSGRCGLSLRCATGGNGLSRCKASSTRARISSYFASAANSVVTLQYSAGVGVNHKDRVMACVQQDGIRRFRADAFLRQQLCPQLLSGCREHRVKRPTKLLHPERRRNSSAAAPFGENNPTGAPIVRVRPTAVRGCLRRSARQPCRRFARARSTLVHEVFWVRMAPSNHLERSFGRPPVLRSPVARQFAIDCANGLRRDDAAAICRLSYAAGR